MGRSKKDFMDDRYPETDEEISERIYQGLKEGALHLEDGLAKQLKEVIDEYLEREREDTE
jgi:hypothetical protein